MGYIVQIKGGSDGCSKKMKTGDAVQSESLSVVTQLRYLTVICFVGPQKMWSQL